MLVFPGTSLAFDPPCRVYLYVLLTLYLGRTAEVRLDVFDFQGKRVYGSIPDLPPGQQQLKVPAEAFPASGVYGWRVTAEGIGVGGKVVRL